MARNYSTSYYGYDYDYTALPLHLCFFFFISLLLLAFSWYINYGSMFESLIDQVKLFVILSPLLLLLVVQLLSSENRRRVPFFISLPEKDSLHRAGGSPWGVALLLVFLLFMISHQSYFHERWFPLRTR
ncbi:hypothetical protein RJ641_034072 [Dillenia turbinata]|uniref:Transmembrane protein n=1 Tax=Dillenia turbinata TaxID=194707 RepID=A0AAN8VWI2_9MAGN